MQALIALCLSISYAVNQCLNVHLKLLFHMMLLRGYVPNNFSLRVVDPILKDNFGDLSSVDNYGLVILSPTIAKIFESVLLIKYGDYLYSVLYVFFLI